MICWCFCVRIFHSTEHMDGLTAFLTLVCCFCVKVRVQTSISYTALRNRKNEIIKIILSLQIIYIIPVRYATKVTSFRYRNATSTCDTGTIHYHKLQDASAHRLELPGIYEQSFWETTCLLINCWFFIIYRVKYFLTHEISYVPDDLPLGSLFLWKFINGANLEPFTSKINAWCRYSTICRKRVNSFEKLSNLKGENKYWFQTTVYT